MRVRNKLPRKHDKDHLSDIHQCPCLICFSRNVEAAHIRYADVVYGKRSTGMQEKPDDRWIVPLCAEHHRTGKDAQHGHNERQWWARHHINPLIIAALIYSHSQAGDIEAMRHVCMNAKAICADPLA